MVRREPARFLFGYVPIAKPKVHSIRGGTSFWVTAGRAGVRSSILTVPVTFPPEEVPNGELLSGLPLPDIRGTMGTFYYFATDLSRYEEGNTEMGGILKRLLIENDVAQTELIGPPNPLVEPAARSDPRGRADARRDQDRAQLAELQAARGRPAADDRSAGTAQARRRPSTSADSRFALQPGRWSKWIDLDFRINFLVRVHGMAQLLLMNAGNELQLYVSPVNWKPDAPPVPMSSPVRLLRRTSSSGSATTARSAGPKRPGRSTRTAWTSRRSWTISIAPSTIARR